MSDAKVWICDQCGVTARVTSGEPWLPRSWFELQFGQQRREQLCSSDCVIAALRPFRCEPPLPSPDELWAQGNVRPRAVWYKPWTW